MEVMVSFQLSGGNFPLKLYAFCIVSTHTHVDAFLTCSRIINIRTAAVPLCVVAEIGGNFARKLNAGAACTFIIMARSSGKEHKRAKAVHHHRRIQLLYAKSGNWKTGDYPFLKVFSASICFSTPYSRNICFNNFFTTGGTFFCFSTNRKLRNLFRSRHHSPSKRFINGL